MNADFLTNTKTRFVYYKSLAEKAMLQISDEHFFVQANEQSNSIANIVKHLTGNILSRWTDFLHTDGEKPWRNRDTEFENPIEDRPSMMIKWEEAWVCLFETLDALTAADLQKQILIRNEAHTVMDAILRQLAHYPYHVGQIVFLAKMLCEHPWISLSIPKGASEEYNASKFR
jgi:hypothetical protein